MNELNTSPDSESNEQPTQARLSAGLFITFLGLLIFIIGAKPNWFGWDRSKVVGFVQIAVFMVGLALICFGGFVSLLGLWKGRQRSIAADIGMRLVSTGYVIAVFTGMADVFGLGSQPLSELYFGPWQAGGVMLGEIVIAVGFLMLIPYRK